MTELKAMKKRPQTVCVFNSLNILEKKINDFEPDRLVLD